MLTIEQCRSRLSDEDQRLISDKTLVILREQLQIFSEIFVEYALTQNSDKNNSTDVISKIVKK